MTTNFSNYSDLTKSASELRADPITGRHAIIAAGRAERPAAFAAPEDTPGAPVGGGRACPFCEGNERLTPPEIWADRPPGAPPDSPGWHVRVVPNKYPAFAPTRADAGSRNGMPNSDRAAPGAQGGAQGGAAAANPLAGAAQPAAGSHEVIVHGPIHRTSLTQLPEETLVAVVATWRGRLAELRRAWQGAVTIITNQGRAAGASIEHSHAQVYASAFRPKLIATEVDRLTGVACAACDLVSREVELGTRVVAEDDGLVALCPWASIMPMEAMLLPARHDPSFESGHDDPLTFARAVTGILRRLHGALGFEPALNLVLHTAPPGVEDFHWHLHVYPRLTIPAGYELGTSTMINIVDPDHAAAKLRAAALPSSAH